MAVAYTGGWHLGGQPRTVQLFSDKVDHMRRLYHDLVVDPARVVDKPGGGTRAHLVSGLCVRVIVQRPNISSYREI